MLVFNPLCAGIRKSQEEDRIQRLVANQNQADTQIARERSRKRVTQPSSSATEIIQNRNQSQRLSAAVRIKKACTKILTRTATLPGTTDKEGDFNQNHEQDSQDDQQWQKPYASYEIRGSVAASLSKLESKFKQQKQNRLSDDEDQSWQKPNALYEIRGSVATSLFKQ